MRTFLLVLAFSAASATLAGLLVRRSLRGHLRNVSSRAQAAEEALGDREQSSQEDRAAQDLILSSMEEGVLLFDDAGKTIFANAPIARHLGTVPPDIDSLLPLDLQKAGRRSAFSGASARLEVETGAPSRWLRASCTPIGDDGSLLVVVHDVTEARRIDAIRRDFVANASHELKTPAASIQAAAETLLHVTDEDPDSVPRFATQLDREARRLSRIVADLLDLTRLESGSEVDGYVRCDTILREEAQRFREPAIAAGVTLRVEARETPAIRGSARDLALLMRNLLDNAISYTKAGGSVTAVLTHDEERVGLSVADTGIGIPRRDIQRVFERFYRVDRARSRETGGTGLGLAIVKHVAENHGGTVRVESELGSGTTFTVELPRKDV